MDDNSLDARTRRKEEWRKIDEQCKSCFSNPKRNGSAYCQAGSDAFKVHLSGVVGITGK